MYSYYVKKTMALMMAAVMIFSFTGCGRSSSKKADETEKTTTKARQSNPDYAKDDVVLPDNFGNMIYPMEAVLLETYARGLPYFTEDSSEEDADSFWFSMAVLTSQMNHYVKDVATDISGGYIYIDEETMNMYASALYDNFGQGNMEFPELDEDSKYARYDDDKGIYGFREGTIGDLEPYITDCKEKNDEYTLTMHLKNKDSAEILASSEITIVPTSYENEENVFHYSVKSFKELKNKDNSDASEKSTADERATTEESDTEEMEDEDADNDDSSSKKISRSEALEKAREYLGDDVEYSYKETVTIGDYDYYDFEVTGEDASSTDVLVSVDGENVMGGTRNDDESWSFDQ